MEKIMEVIRALSCDPGTKNSAMFVADITLRDGKIKKFKVVASFMMTVTRTDHTSSSRKEFQKYIKTIKKKYKPDVFVCERFQPRGIHLKCSIIEQVNWMISEMCSIFNVDEKLVTAASWKNAYTKRGKVDLKEIYKEFKTIGPHRLDCMLMLLNQYNINHKNTKNFVKSVYSDLVNCK